MAEVFYFELDQGATFSADITLTDENGNPINVTGFTVRAQMRKSYTSNIYYDFDIDIGGVDSNSVLDSNGFHGVLDTITIKLPASTTEDIDPGRYVYDVEIDNAGEVTRVVEGIITVKANATR